MTHQTNILRTLRELVPERTLTANEAERIAELQANRLRELLQIESARFPEEAVYNLPRIQVERDVDMSVSGMTFWHNGKWVIRINGTEPFGRMRFSLAHELKHVLDHSTKHWLYPATLSKPADIRAEQLSDYFAGCLLMPKRHVKRLFGERKSLSQLAALFEVTPRAMTVRLWQLGLTDPLPRCQRLATTTERRTHPYGRPRSLSSEVAA